MQEHTCTHLPSCTPYGFYSASQLLPVSYYLKDEKYTFLAIMEPMVLEKARLKPLCISNDIKCKRSYYIN